MNGDNITFCCERKFEFIFFVYIIGFLMEELLSHVSVMKGISYFLGIKFFICAFFV